MKLFIVIVIKAIVVKVLVGFNLILVVCIVVCFCLKRFILVILLVIF